MPSQRYSIGEATALLNIDRVTLTRWLAAEVMSPQTDLRDKRFKYLTRADIERLARIHERTIRDEPPVGPRLTGWQRDIAARVQALEQWRADVEQNYHLIPRYTRGSAQQPAYTPLAVSVYPADTEPSESSYSASGGYQGRERLKRGEWDTLPDIPPGWLSPLDMARLLGVPPRTFTHKLAPRFDGDKERYGALTYHTGKWRRPHPGLYATELLDQEQQDAARELFGRG